MDLPPATIANLRTHLKSCTALVRIGGESRGTAFFISETQLLTCAHVVKDNAEVEIEPFLRAGRTARVVAREPQSGLDLALLEVDPIAGEEPQPCVLLDEQGDEADYYVAGYPREDGHTAGLEVFRLSGHLREDNTGALQQLQLEAGKQITWGLSGGPVFSTAVGAVTAVVRVSHDPQGALGGGAVPIKNAMEVFEPVRRAVRNPPLAVRTWRDTLGMELWQQMGRTWGMDAQVDLIVSGERNKWLITTDPTGAPGQYISGRDLGDDVTEAMFRWAQGKRIHVAEEVELLGRLLASALFPSAVASQLNILGKADEVLVRLHVQPETKLADVPWELAAVPNHAGQFLAADPRFRFVRVDDTAHAARSPAPKEVTLKVLGVMGLPSRWRFPTLYAERTYEWPEVEDIWSKLRDNFIGKAAELTLLTTPDPVGVREELATGSYDILHYVGVGRLGKNDQAQLSMVEPGEGDAIWQKADEVLSWAANGGVRLVVFEFTLPPPDQVVEPVTPSALGEMLQGSVRAVVFARFPVHPRQFQSFNRVFYEHLLAGDTVETAVQLGRGMLQQSNIVEDVAGFGWFTLVTGPQPGFRLLAPRAPSPQAPRPSSAADERGGGSQGGTSQGAVVSDEFNR